ncbi:hypothetical protein L9F63_010477, partial [Diploptera punctata]
SSNIFTFAGIFFLIYNRRARRVECRLSRPVIVMLNLLRMSAVDVEDVVLVVGAGIPTNPSMKSSLTPNCVSRTFYLPNYQS